VRHIVAAEFHDANVTLVLQHKGGQRITASLEDEDDCIYSGYMVGCTTSSVVVTGCKGELQAVQIQSKVFGDMVFTTQDGVVMPVESRRGKRDADYDDDIDYDYDDTLDNPEFEEMFADLDSAEVEDLDPPPPTLTLNLNVYLDKNWAVEFGKIGGSIYAKKILKQASLLLAHDSLKTKIELVSDPNKFYISSQHLLPGKNVYTNLLPRELIGPDHVSEGETAAHLYLTAAEGKSKILGLSKLNGMCMGGRSKPRSIIYFKSDELRTSMTVAHELGHLLGIEHDFVLGKRERRCGRGKESGEFVMNYGKNRQKFSECSNSDFNVYYNRVILERHEFCLKGPLIG
jgi:hypothetical protein